MFNKGKQSNSVISSDIMKVEISYFSMKLLRLKVIFFVLTMLIKLTWRICFWPQFITIKTSGVTSNTQRHNIKSPKVIKNVIWRPRPHDFFIERQWKCSLLDIEDNALYYKSIFFTVIHIYTSLIFFSSHDIKLVSRFVQLEINFPVIICSWFKLKMLNINILLITICFIRQIRAIKR